MSVEKVDQYKEAKKNRKENLAKEKKQKKLVKTAWIAVGVILAFGLLAALGATGINQFKDWKNALPIYDREEIVIGDIAGVLETEEETTAEVSETTAEAK